MRLVRLETTNRLVVFYVCDSNLEKAYFATAVATCAGLTALTLKEPCTTRFLYDVHL